MIDEMSGRTTTHHSAVLSDLLEETPGVWTERLFLMALWACGKSKKRRTLLARLLILAHDCPPAGPLETFQLWRRSLSARVGGPVGNAV